MKITEDIHQLKVPMSRNPLGKTYSYLFKNSKTLIDTGVPTEEAYQGLRKELNKHGLQPQDIENIIITHLHNDHIGLVETLQGYGAKVMASTIAAEKQASIRDLSEVFFEQTVAETKLFGGAEYLDLLYKYEFAFRDAPNPITIDRTLSDGETLKLEGIEFEVIYTPGHAQEHIVLHDKADRILFSGDHVLPKITSHVSCHSYEARDPLNEYLTSLDKIKDMDVKHVYPAHEWDFTDLKGRVEQLYKHHGDRLMEMKAPLKDGPKTVYQIGSIVHWDSRPWPEMSFWTKRMAATETYAHLIYLRNKGEIQEETRNNTLYYSLV
ncbi:MAG: MBL fold metallo-hydrolase [Candidatus Bathyarchaeota archaeon]|nr:MBL fold metallo-hydrolase [Candidatus Bathyarchaeota archaeon]